MAGPKVALTSAPTVLNSFNVILNAFVNNQSDLPTTVVFEYGLTMSYELGTINIDQDLEKTLDPGINVTANLNNIFPDKTYHYRINVDNGTLISNNTGFITLDTFAIKKTNVTSMLAVSPTVNYDESMGYNINDKITNVVLSEEYICKDNTIGNAIWEKYVTGEGGGGAVTVTDITHADLYTLWDNDGFTPNAQYRITDFVTKYQQPESNEILTGNTEPLIVIASGDGNSLYQQAYSEQYPNDIIYYDFLDMSCEDGTWDSASKKFTGGTARTGKITYRKDTVRNLSCYYDWRNVKFRRWKLDCSAGSSPYVKGNVYKSLSIYKCVQNTPSAFFLNNYYFQKVYDLYTFTFLSPTYDTTLLSMGNIDTTNFIINNSTPGVDYNDYYTFTILNDLTNSSGIVTSNGMGYRNFEIGYIDPAKVNYDDNIGRHTSYLSYSNNVFFLQPNNTNEYFYYDIKIGNNSAYNTIYASQFYNNEIGDDFYSNMIFSGFINNNIRNNVYSNIFSNQTINNNIGSSTYSNVLVTSNNNDIIGEMYQNNFGTLNDNIIQESCYSNTFHGLGSCIIGNNFHDNSADTGFQYNIIGSNFNNNNFAQFTQYNTIGSDVSDINSVGTNYLQKNTIASDISLNGTLNSVFYGNYDCNVFTSNNSNIYISYFNGTTLTVENALSI